MQRLQTKQTYARFWKHGWRPISCSQVVDDFGVKYIDKQHAKHTIAILEEDYSISHYWEGKRYLGLTLDWDYEIKEVMVLMPGYVKKSTQRFHYLQPKKSQDQLHPHLAPKYGTKGKYTEQEDTPPPLNRKDPKFFQDVVLTFLY